MTGLIRSELLKVVTTRVWWGLLIGVVAQAAGLALLTALLLSVAGPDGTGGADWHDPAWARTVYTAGLSFAFVAIARPFAAAQLSATFAALSGSSSPKQRW